MNNKDFFLSLADCKTDNEVINILKKNGYWDDFSKWQPFGGIEDNSSTIGNQAEKQSRGVDINKHPVSNIPNAKQGFKMLFSAAPFLEYQRELI